MLIFTGVYGFGEKPVYMFCAGFSYTPVLVGSQCICFVRGFHIHRFSYTPVVWLKKLPQTIFFGACLWNPGRIWVGGEGAGRGLLMGR